MQRVSKFAENEITGFRSRLGAVGSRGARELSAPALLGNTPQQRKKNLQFFFLMTLASTALMIAALIVVWWYVPLWTARGESTQTSAEYQRVYLTWVANKYAETKNLPQVEQQLATWKRADLANFLPLLAQEAAEPETRRRLIAVRDALRLPIPQSNFSPTEWSADYQRLYIIWVASQYWRSGDGAQAQKSLAIWKRDDLAKQLLDLQRSTTDAETRRNLVVLTEALRLPFSESSIGLFIFQQPGVVLGMLLAAVPLLAAAGFVNLPQVRKIRRRILKRIGVMVKEEEEAAVGTNPNEASLDELLAQAQAAEAEAQAEAGVQAADVPGQEQEAEKKEEEEADAQSGGLGDLASLFEEEDTSVGALEAFCKGMAEINIDELLTLGKNVVYQFRAGKRIDPSDAENKS
jgi:ribosomal protein L12E/L44/L45/RPP1/RPP2